MVTLTLVHDVYTHTRARHTRGTVYRVGSQYQSWCTDENAIIILSLVCMYHIFSYRYINSITRRMHRILRQ